MREKTLKDRYHCTGCAACEAVCPTGSICMQEDSERFLHPVINTEKCIDCKLCEKICNKTTVKNNVIKAYAVQFCDEEILSKSTSGGAITGLCNNVLKKGGVIYAATYAVNDGGVWLRIENDKELSKIRGSKYLQISLRRSEYDQINEDLEHKPVLFIGTPCQVDGIKKMFSENYKDNLILVDIICGGVISEHIERLYERYIESIKGNTISERVFRGKKDNIWKRAYCSENHYSDGTKDVYMGGDDLYTRAFTSERLLREACYNCEYTSLHRVGDITVGDCWGIENEIFEFPNMEKGVSLVLINTEKGVGLFNETEDIISVELQNKIPIETNKPLHECTRRHRMRNYAYVIYDKLSFKRATSIVCYRYSLKKLIRGNR